MTHRDRDSPEAYNIPAMEPRIQYAQTKDGVNIAFCAHGKGTPLVQMWNPQSHIRQQWEVPEFRTFYERLAQNRMLVQYDNRGTGLSERDVSDFSLEALALDIAAVADRLGLERFALWGPITMGPVAIAYAARHPERVSHLILWCSYARGSDLLKSPQVQVLERLMDNWELYTDTTAHYAFGWGGGEAARRYAATIREGITQETLRAFTAQFLTFDVTDLLPQVRAPTLVPAVRAKVAESGLGPVDTRPAQAHNRGGSGQGVAGGRVMADGRG